MIELYQNEKILLMQRKHWFVFVSHLLPLILLYFLPFILLSLMGKLIDASTLNFSLASIDERLFVFLALFWTLIIWMFSFMTWTDYYLDVWVLTDKRIIDIEQLAFFRREVSSFRYEQIQDMTVKVHGALATFFDFGSLEVQTAGSSAKLSIQGVAHPNQLRDTIFERMETPQKESILATSPQ